MSFADVLARARAEGRTLLSEVEAKDVLREAGVPVTLTTLGFVDVDSPSYAVRPAIELSGHDHWAVEIAATIYGGPEGSYGGIYDDADEVTLTVQYGL